MEILLLILLVALAVAAFRGPRYYARRRPVYDDVMYDEPLPRRRRFF